MPLHDWADLSGWEGVHHSWITELQYALKPLLPAAYRVYIGTTPTFALGAPRDGRPDVGVRDWPPAGAVEAAAADDAADEEVMVATSLASDATVMVERGGRLVAAIELVSPRNKDRISAQANYGGVYASYLMRGVHLLLVDVHRRPAGFSFADRVAEEVGLPVPTQPAPFAVAYRVDGPAPEGGRFVATRRRTLIAGEPLPTLPLSLAAGESVPVDLESTYRRAAEASYLD